LSPSLDRSAASTVTDPTTAATTTNIVPIASEVKIAFPARNIPAMATSTVAPEMSTAIPDVPAARSSASRGDRPA
jgi:hypothetical protein